MKTMIQTMKLNKNVENTYNQIANTLELLDKKNIISYYYLPEINEDKKNNIQQITWIDTEGGRSVSGKAFLRIEQYLHILRTKAYHALLTDNSIIRCSFCFEGSELISQNLLWWPCPIIVEQDVENGMGLIETIENYLNEKDTALRLQMRSPVRIDFDVNNDKDLHPRAHMHIQHPDCRINTNEPVCFNKFIKHILINYYPDIDVDFKHWDYLTYHYKDKHKKSQYYNKTQFNII